MKVAAAMLRNDSTEDFSNKVLSFVQLCVGANETGFVRGYARPLTKILTFDLLLSQVQRKPTGMKVS
jgi:hypothetical protein